MIELLTPRDMAVADRLTIEAGTPGIVLMERAGAAVAAAARKMWRGGRIVVLCGTGNNGGDGFVAARLLRDAGYSVSIALLGEGGRIAGDAGIAMAAFLGEVVAAHPERFAGAGLVIDALYGAGFRLPLAAEAAAVVAAANECGAPILAVDLPSGVDGATGQAEIAIQALRSITFFRKKPGHVLLPGRELCGEVEVVDIGIGASTLASIVPQTFLNRPKLWRDGFPIPGAAAHKYDRGHLLVVAGPAGFGGAARLAARAGLRAAAGLVTVAASKAAMAENAARLDAVMLRRCDGADDLTELLADERRNAAAIGPGLGLGAEARALVQAALAAPAALACDADALTLASADADGFFRAIGKRRAGVVLTPHEGEFRRLFPALAGPKLERARAAAAMSGAVVVLKGADTVVASPDGRAAIADNAPPWLATAGSGDVLTGMVGGLLAAHMPPFEAAAAAVFLHGEAASAFGAGLIAEDLSEELPSVLKRLQSEGRAGFRD